MYPSSKKQNSPWQLELFPHQKYECLKGCEQKSIALLTEGQFRTFALSNTPLLHSSPGVTELKLKIFH